MQPWSITRELLRSLLMLVSALWICATLIATLVVTEETNEVYDNALEGTAKILATLVPLGHSPIDARTSLTLESLALSGERSEYISYQIRGADGVVRERSKNAPATAYPAPLMNGFANVGPNRYYTYVLGDGQSIQVAEEPHERREALLTLLASFLLPLLALILVGAIVVWRTVRRVSQPIRFLAENIGRRSGQDLSPLNVQEAPEELKPIVLDTNRLLRRLKRALEAERAFSANWAHELRNPVAAARAQAELVVGALASSPHHARAELVLSAMQDLSGRIERLLQKSRADAGPAVGAAPSDLISVAELVIDGYYYLPSKKRIEFDDGGHMTMPVAIEQDGLAIVLQNLIDNAIAYSNESSTIRVWIAEGPTIHIANDGPVVPADELINIRYRFQRGSGSMAPGFGLGLSIVQQILRRSGGSFELRSPASGCRDGFEAIVKLLSPSEQR
ncbi:ATP-binding protein [Hyphomicrobium sp. CS1BSMeth3]|uniref:sensor histidine kinase n=1 Tax=Hyphomicrobium sp. CS1BSMeth3 TaxID=1892844 RepID=UPI000931530F|nr:ATP-binding protein [Hyphomicrobium sp. CS1BSMeth3]